jgi:hypothetical protein
LGKLAKGFSDREVAVDLGPDYDMTEENSLEGTQRHGLPIIMSVGSTCKVLCKSISNFPSSSMFMMLMIHDVIQVHQSRQGWGIGMRGYPR